MLNNFQSWGERRKLEIMSDDPASAGLDKPEECRKMDERLAKFNGRMSFVSVLRDLPRRKRLSIHSTGV